MDCTNITLVGTISQISAIERVGPNKTEKCIIILETEGAYPQALKLDFMKDSVQKLNGFKTGDRVQVQVNLRGHEYNGKFYTNLTGWRIERANLPANAPQQATPQRERITTDLNAGPGEEYTY